MLFYQLKIEEALAELRTAPHGISGEEAYKRLRQYGPNELVEKKKKTLLRMFLGQFMDFLILVLIAAALVSGFMGEAADAVAIMTIVLTNAALGFMQEYRAEKTMTALKGLAVSPVTVLRSGVPLTAQASELVPGDIVLLEAGDVAPADLRLIDARRLQVNEAALTGESLPVQKHTDAIYSEAPPLGDRRNMVYKGTAVTSGRGKAMVTATGMDTELGRIAALIQEEAEPKTPLQKRLADFGKKLGLAVLAICAIIFIGGLFRGEDPLGIFLIAVSLAVAAIPEALPAIVTITLAMGAGKMMKQKALVRNLPAVETLGSITHICTDKTGTLTLNIMTVEELWVDGMIVRRSSESGGDLQRRTALGVLSEKPQEASIRNPQALLFTALALSNDARFGDRGNIIGDPTEAALFSVAVENGFDKKTLETIYPRIAELPFDSSRKLMTTFHAWENNSVISFTKGALEALAERSTNVITSKGVAGVGPRELIAESERMSAEGLRVIGIAMRIWAHPPRDLSAENVESKLTLVGMAGMMDPPREEAREAVGLCRTAGITPVMITGDHPLTARAIAIRVGILGADASSAVMSGAELATLSNDELEKRVGSIRVYARVAPEQKLLIVKALQGQGHFVAMTGDGVNDAPALKRADIGVAMGLMGTDVAKEASSMVLLDDNFSTIVKAVQEGRRIYDNVRKFVKYLLSTNSGELWTLFLAPFMGLPIPLVPIQILWMNLLTDGLPALALSLEPEEGDVMKRPPRDPKESIFAHGLGLHAVWVGLLMAAVTLSLQAWSIRGDNAHWQTMVFAVLCFLQLGHVMAIRSERESLFQQGLLSNKPLLASVAAMACLQLVTIYVPELNSVFRTQPLSGGELLLVLVLSSIVFIAVELEKLIKRRTRLRGAPATAAPEKA